METDTFSAVPSGALVRRCKKKSACVVAALALAMVLALPSARADTVLRCPALAGAPKTERLDASARLHAVTEVVMNEHRAMIAWNRNWLAIFAGASLVQYGAASGFDETGRRVDYTAGATKAAIGAASIIVAPLRVHEPPTPTGELCADVAAAEAALIKAAATQRRGKTWFRRGQGLALNVVTVLIVGLGWERWTNGLLSAAVGTAVGELRMWAQPTGAISALEAYRGGLLPEPARTPSGLLAQPTVGSDHFAVMLTTHF